MREFSLKVAFVAKSATNAAFIALATGATA
jgi:hypothetical protein